MKNLIIIIGTMALAVVIVNTMILGDGASSLKGAAKDLIEKGVNTMNEMNLGGNYEGTDGGTFAYGSWRSDLPADRRG